MNGHWQFRTSSKYKAAQLIVGNSFNQAKRMVIPAPFNCNISINNNHDFGVTLEWPASSGSSSCHLESLPQPVVACLPPTKRKETNTLPGNKLLQPFCILWLSWCFFIQHSTQYLHLSLLFRSPLCLLVCLSHTHCLSTPACLNQSVCIICLSQVPENLA